MFACWLNRKKMVDYFESTLPSAEEARLQKHLDVCGPCRKIFSDSGVVIRLAASKIPPNPGEAFWKDFDASLSRKLDGLAEKKAAGRARPGLWFNLRPALVMVPLALVVIALGIRVLPMVSFYKSVSEADLVSEVVLLDEIASNGDNKSSGLDDILEDVSLYDEIDALGA